MTNTEAFDLAQRKARYGHQHWIVWATRNGGYEAKLATLVGKINGLVQKLNILGTNAISSSVTGVELEIERSRLRERCAKP